MELSSLDSKAVVPYMKLAVLNIVYMKCPTIFMEEGTTLAWLVKIGSMKAEVQKGAGF